MKKSLLAIAFVLAALASFSQCTVSLLLNPLSPCTGEYILIGNSDCPAAVTFEVTVNNFNGIPPTTQTFTTPNFEMPLNMFPGVNSFGQICASVNAYDDLGNLVYEGQNVCFGVAGPVNVYVNTVQSPTYCFEYGCVTFVAYGGYPPYTYQINGVTFNPTPGTLGSICDLAPGDYSLIVLDQIGCVGVGSFTIEASPDTGINGYLFNDINGDGIQQTEGIFAEPGVANEAVTIVEAGLVIYSDENGHFTVGDLPTGTYTVQWTDSNGLWIEENITLESQENDCLTIPLHSTSPVYNVYANVSSSSSIFPCNPGFNGGVWLVNNGNASFNGTVEVAFDSSLTFSYIGYGIEYSASEPGHISWDVNDQNAGSYDWYSAHFYGPGAAYVGLTFSFTYTVNLYDGDGNVFYTNSWTENKTVTCSYDPNDKSAFPEGYAAPHFITNDQELTYQVRFQNTGNATAERVELIDQIDMSSLDISTFEPLASSHNMVTEVLENGEVHFIFDNIQLPDSISNEAASHGFVTYRISPLPELGEGTVIENTASIYFDSNEAVVTNTTFHTIMECSLIPTISGSEDLCIDELINASVDYAYADSFEWTWDGEVIGTDATVSAYQTTAGEHQLGLTISNPLCTVMSIKTINSHEMPAVSLDFNNGVITAQPAGNYVWTLDGVVLDGETSSAITVTESGDYGVTVIDEFGCTGFANINVVGIDLLHSAKLQVYPNPSSEFVTIQLPTGKWNITIEDVLGRIVQKELNQINRLNLNAGNWSTGTYFVSAQNDLGRMITEKVIIK